MTCASWRKQANWRNIRLLKGRKAPKRRRRRRNRASCPTFFSAWGFFLVAEAVEIQEYLNVKQVTALLGISRNTLYIWQRDRDFPKALKIGSKAVRFRRSEILAWLETRPRATGEIGLNR